MSSKEKEQKIEADNRYLFTRMHPNKCWHVWEFSHAEYLIRGNGNQCKKCSKLQIVEDNPDLHTAPGFFELLEWAKEQEWWDEFLYEYGDVSIPEDEVFISCLWIEAINYYTFPGKVVEFLEERV